MRYVSSARMVIALILLLSATQTGAAPAWRPAAAAELKALVRCEVVIGAEIARRSQRLDPGDWTIAHQAVWRLEAERTLLRRALRTVMDRDSAAAARAALMPGGAEALPTDARRRIVGDCAPLVEAVHAAGDADAGPFAALPAILPDPWDPAN